MKIVMIVVGALALRSCYDTRNPFDILFYQKCSELARHTF